MNRLLSALLIVFTTCSGLLAGDYKTFRFPDGYQVRAINASGQVAGIGNGQVFIWSRAVGFQFLGNQTGGTSTPVAINSSGALTGFSDFPDGTRRAFVWTLSDGFLDPGSPLGGHSSGFSINANGEVAGITYTPDASESHGLFWSASTGPVDIGTLNGDRDSGTATLNNHGEVIGSSTDVTTHETAFRWTNSGGIVGLPSFGGSGSFGPDSFVDSFPYVINDKGLIAGLSTYPDQRQRAALWKADGSIKDLGILPGDEFSLALFMNEGGHIAGVSTTRRPNQNDLFLVVARTFFWTPDTGIVDIGAGVETNPGLFGINNHDLILGQAAPTSTSGIYVYLWSPTLGVHTIANINAHPLVGTFNDAGQFLSQNGLVAKLWTPVMHVGLGSSRNPSQAGQSVTFTANVSSIVGPPPDGEHVEFMDGAKLLGPGTLNNGVARLTTSVLKAGTHSVKAIYDGDTNYSLTESAVLQQVVNP